MKIKRGGERGVVKLVIVEEKTAIGIIIHLSRLRDKSRKTVEITEVIGYENGEIQLNPLYVFEEDENTTLEKVSGSLKRTKNKMQNVFKLQLAGIKVEV